MPHILTLQAACNIELYAQDAAAASARLDAAWPNVDRSGVLRVQHLRVELSLLRAQLALADTARPADERAKVVRSIGDDLVKEGADWAAGIGQFLWAASMALRGDHETAGMTLRAAEELLETAGMRGWLQVARLRRGRGEREPGGSARAVAAGELLTELGAANPEAIATLLVPWPT
jgi:hypothetical protein